MSFISEGKESKSGKTPAPAIVLENLRLTLTDYRKRLDNTSDEVFEPCHDKTCPWFDRNLAVQLQEMARGLKFQIQEVEGLNYLCSAFVFAYTKSWLSHVMA